MESQSLKLGNVEIGKYISESPLKLTEERKKEMKKLISELEGKALNIEQVPLTLLKIEREQYQTIDPSFLSMHNIIDHQGEKIYVPKFSVYKKNEEGFSDFSISFVNYQWGSFLEEPKVTIVINRESGNLLPRLFEEPLIKSTEFFSNFMEKEVREDSGGNRHHRMVMPSYKKSITRELREKYKRICDFELKSEFYGILPQEAKEKIEEVEPIFKRELCLIAETRPEQWAVTKLIRDPLLVGFFKENCYLISHFNTTSIENYVRSEFT